MNLSKVIAVRPKKTVYKDGKYLIKVFDENYSKADVLNEALNQARVEQTGLKIPQIEEVIKVGSKWAIVSDFIEGKTLEALFNEYPERFEEYMQKFVDTQIDIHSKQCPMLNKLTEKMQDKISLSKLDATTRYELHTRLESMPKHHKVCHGDYNPSNVIVKDNGDFYVIDWAHVTQGNASADAARTYLLFVLGGKFETAEMYFDLFCRKTDTAKQYVQSWLPIVAASQSVKGKTEEQEILLNWVNVVDYE